MKLAFVGALVCALVLTGVIVPILRRAQFLDLPNHRSSHTRPVPRGGGLAVVATLVLVSFVAADRDIAVVGLLAATVALSAVGFIDDVRALPTNVRLAAQLAIAIGLSVTLITSGEAPWWWLPVLVIGLAGYVNAYNFMDGINGISGTTAAAVGFWWAWAGHSEDQAELALLGLVLAGAAIGFLPWNAPRARVFLGDVGSYGIGLFIAGLSAIAIVEGLPWSWAVAPVAVYGADTGWVLLKRALGSRSLTEAHREHVYQRLVDGGWSHLASAALCAGATALICVTVVAGGTSLEWWAAALTGVVVFAYLNAPRLVVGAGRTQ